MDSRLKKHEGGNPGLFDLVMGEVATSLFNSGSISRVVNSYYDCVKILFDCYIEHFLSSPVPRGAATLH